VRRRQRRYPAGFVRGGHDREVTAPQPSCATAPRADQRPRGSCRIVSRSSVVASSAAERSTCERAEAALPAGRCARLVTQETLVTHLHPFLCVMRTRRGTRPTVSHQSRQSLRWIGTTREHEQQASVRTTHGREYPAIFGAKLRHKVIPRKDIGWGLRNPWRQSVAKPHYYRSNKTFSFLKDCDGGKAWTNRQAG
jgi:hypothetical protein